MIAFAPSGYFCPARLFWLMVIAGSLVAHLLLLLLGSWYLVRTMRRQQVEGSRSLRNSRRNVISRRRSQSPSRKAAEPLAIQNSLLSLSTARLTSFRTGTAPSAAKARTVQGAIVEYRLGNHSRDIPDRIAVPKKKHMILAGAVHTQHSLANVNQIAELRILVTRMGNAEAETIQVLKSTGFTSLDHLAKLMIRRWKFEPAMQNNQPVASLLDIKFQIIFR